MSDRTLEIPFGSKGGRIIATVCEPKDLVPSRPGRLVMIFHGQAGNKNYCYQRLLAQELAEKRGLCSVRFDFRGCGDSSEADDGEITRGILRDIEDIQTVYDFLCSPSRQQKRSYVLVGLVGHSRGSAAAFMWALKVQHHIVIPTIVNCCGRYDYAETQEWVDRVIPSAVKDGGYFLPTYKNGSKIDVWQPYAEVLLLGAEVDMTKVSGLDEKTSVLSIYALKDTIVHIRSAASFSNILDGRHTLRFVDGADHNFYGTSKEENYNPVVANIISDEWFTEEAERKRFMDSYRYSGTISRWKEVGGVNNFRDFGGYRSKLHNRTVRPGLLFRSAGLAHITSSGKKELSRLGIVTVFDLRSDHEVEKKPCPQGLEGITIRRVPVYKDQDLDPVALARRYANYGDPAAGFERAYVEIVRKAGPGPYREILTHIRDHPQGGILIHCTAGKDRTGVICAVILLLLGVDKDTVAREYELTTWGLRDEVNNILDALAAERSSWDDNQDAMRRMLSSTYESMLAFINVLDTEFGGAEMYVKHYCGFTDRDIATIRQHLTAEEGRGWTWTHSLL